MTSERSENKERPTHFSIYVPDEHLGGTYSNFVSVWSTAYEFTLDFCATQPAIMPEEDTENPDEPVTVPCAVVSRVRIPTTLIYEVFRALDDNLDSYEKVWGEIREPTGSQEEEE